jgi:ATP-dependent exoDNAse (exonuclease V) beta subunit
MEDAAATDEIKIPATKTSVALMTIHLAKGLEFPHVFLLMGRRPVSSAMSREYKK